MSQTPPLVTTLVPVPSFINQTTPERKETRVNAVQLLFYSATPGPYIFGDQVTFIVEARPVRISTLYGATGEILGTSIIPWVGHSIDETGLSLTWEAGEQAGLDWLEFQERLEFIFPVDWIGRKQLNLEVRFSDRSQAAIPIYTGDPGLMEVARIALDAESIWNRSTPLEALPPPIQTLVAHTQSAYPLAGAVVWEEGRCCAGGTAGQTIQVKAKFSASSPYGEVTEMRLRTGGMCFPEVELGQVSWEPFVPEKSFPFTLPVNWVGFYISVQYRDQAGNLSPVYCDDISLEGMPPPR